MTYLSLLILIHKLICQTFMLKKIIKTHNIKTIESNVIKLATNLTLWFWSKISNTLFVWRFERWLWLTLRFPKDARLRVCTKRLIRISMFCLENMDFTVFGKIWLLVFLKFVLAKINYKVSLGKIELLDSISLS